MKTLREAAALAGRRTVALLAAGAALGAGLTGVELGFAFCLQAFLLELGALAPQAFAWPDALPRPDGPAVYVALIVAGAARAGLVGLQTYLQGAAAEELKHALRGRLIARVFRARSASAADTMTLFTARSEAFGSAAAAVQALSTQALLSVLLLASLLAIAPALTLAAAGLLVLASLPLRLADRRARHSGDSLGVEWQRVTERLLASVRNLLLLQILGTRERERDRALGHLSGYRAHVLSYYAVLGLKQAVPQALGLAAVAGAAAWAARGATTSPGALVSFFYLFLRLVQVAAQAGQAATTLSHSAPQVEAFLDWARRPEDAMPHAPSARPAERVGWRVRAARLRYPGEPADALGGVDLDLSPGECLVVTGPSGSGKSSLLALLLGLIEPSSGEVAALLDGEAAPAAGARGRLLPAVGYVGPEPFLVEGSVRQNLFYGLEREPSEAEIDAALSAADCGFLRASARGLERQLTEQGHGLSAGQKQRLSLARALLRRPAALVLDEATSNLDEATEARVVRTLSGLKGRLTLLIVSHRPALLALADKRLSLEPGAVEELA